ncbi:hypothetical protein [Streptomyces parvus]|uniref:hypothetical protein n=1 Tax=Streptomyces parvus TaxID=66428 RepID=UPI0038107DF4
MRFALEQTGEWIRAADAKTGLLGAALAVLVAAITAKFDRAHVANWSEFPGDAIKAGLLAVTLISLVKSAYNMKSVLAPRTQPGSEATRYSWPWVESTSIEGLVQLPPSTSRREAWVQAKTLAIIAKEKHRNFTVALRWSAITTGFFLLWVGSLAWFE